MWHLLCLYFYLLSHILIPGEPEFIIALLSRSDPVLQHCFRMHLCDKNGLFTLLPYSPGISVVYPSALLLWATCLARISRFGEACICRWNVTVKMMQRASLTLHVASSDSCQTCWFWSKMGKCVSYQSKSLGLEKQISKGGRWSMVLFSKLFLWNT